MALLSELALWSGGKARDVSEQLLRLTASDTPYFSMVKKGRRVFNSTPEWPYQARPSSSQTTVADGTDVSNNDLRDYESLHGMLQGRAAQVRVPFGVGKRAQAMTRQYGGIKDKFKQYGLLAMEECGLNIESILKGTQDSWTETVSSQPRDQTRGLFRWLDCYATPTDLAIPSAARNPSGSKVTNRATVGAYTEDDVRGVMKSIAETAKRKKGNYVMLASPGMKQVISNLGYSQSVGATTGTHSVPLRRFTEDAKSKTITLDVTAYEGDFGTIKVMPDFDLNNASTSYATTYAATADNGLGRTAAAQKMDAALLAGTRIDWYLLNLDFLEVSMVQAPMMTTLPDNGGGPRAYVDAIFVHCVLNPQQHGAGFYVTP